MLPETFACLQKAAEITLIKESKIIEIGCHQTTLPPTGFPRFDIQQLVGDEDTVTKTVIPFLELLLPNRKWVTANFSPKGTQKWISEWK
jgi:hypothetical protein